MGERLEVGPGFLCGEKERLGAWRCSSAKGLYVHAITRNLEWEASTPLRQTPPSGWAAAWSTSRNAAFSKPVMLIIVSQFHLFRQNSRRSSSWAWFSQPYLYLEFISLTFKPSNHFVVSRALYESMNCTTHEWKKLTSHHNGQMSQNLTDGQAPTLLCLRVSHLVLRRQRSRLLQDTHFRGTCPRPERLSPQSWGLEAGVSLGPQPLEGCPYIAV